MNFRSLYSQTSGPTSPPVAMTEKKCFYFGTSEALDCAVLANLRSIVFFISKLVSKSAN